MTLSNSNSLADGSQLGTLSTNDLTKTMFKILWEGKSPFAAIHSSRKRLLNERGRDFWRCLNNYLVTCVQRNLQVGMAFTITSRSIVGSRNTIANNVKNHLVGIIYWRGTPLFTPGRNLKTAHIATIPVMMLPTSKGISRTTSGRNCSIAINVNTKQKNQSLWRCTRGDTLEKSHTDAQYASIRALKLRNWKLTLWGSTRTKNRSNVISATTLVLNLVICRGTWGSTLGKNHSSATNATRLSNGDRHSEDILGRIKLQIRCLTLK